MARYTCRRILTGILSLFVLITVTFFLVRIIPGSPFQRGGVSESVVEAIEQEYGLNEPLFTQYLSYIGGVLHGDLGISYQDPAVRVTEVIARAWPVTASVGTAALIVSLIMGTGLGILSAVSGRRSVKQVISAGGMIAAGIPGFAAAILLMLVFSVKLKLRRSRCIRRPWSRGWSAVRWRRSLRKIMCCLPGPKDLAGGRSYLHMR